MIEFFIFNDYRTQDQHNMLLDEVTIIPKKIPVLLLVSREYERRAR